MDYKRNTSKLLKKAKDLHDNHALGMPFIYQTCEQIFPELKESEDEKIRKEIIQFLQLPHPQFVGKRNHEEWIAWLEKQGEQKSEEEVDNLHNYLYDEQNPADEVGDYDHKEVLQAIINEQNHAWSEEDEQYFISILGDIGIADKNMNEETYQRKRKWLENKFNSLKPQNTWKPSDEQMDALSNALSLAKSCGEESSYDLRTLYEQLNKLREE